MAALQNFKQLLCFCVCVCLLLDDRSFGAPCCREHDPGGEADPQVLLHQAQQLGAVLQRLTRLVLDGAAACERRRRAESSSGRRGVFKGKKLCVETRRAVTQRDEAVRRRSEMTQCDSQFRLLENQTNQLKVFICMNCFTFKFCALQEKYSVCRN